MSELRRVAGIAGGLAVREWPGARGAASGAAPIVLFHDSLGSISLWRDFPAELAQTTGRRVIAYDRLGFGASDPHPGRLAPDFVATEAVGDFAAVKAALGIGRFVALGHSVGGGMALFAAAAFPGECAAVVSISAQARNDDRIRDGITAAKEAFAEPDQLERLARHHGDKAGWVLDSWTETWRAPTFDGYSVAPARDALRCPVLAIHGSADEYGAPDHASAIAGRDGTLVLLPGLGHFPHREDAPQVIARIAAFLSGLPDA